MLKTDACIKGGEEITTAVIICSGEMQECTSLRRAIRSLISPLKYFPGPSLLLHSARRQGSLRQLGWGETQNQTVAAAVATP